MDSDSSRDGDDCHNGTKRRDWENRQNSDVSDDENFSRGAKSIDSPPESPPRGGGNLDSPPASPAQGVESPHSVYSGSRRSSGSSDGTADFPQSPDSPPPKTPESVDNDDNPNRDRRAQISLNEDSRGRASSPSPNQSRSVSPGYFDKHRRTSETPSPRGNLRPSTYGSPESNDSGHMRTINRGGPESPEELQTITRESSLSPRRGVEANRGRSQSPDDYRDDSRHLSMSPERETRAHNRSPGRSRSFSPYNLGNRSPVTERHSQINSPDSHFSRRNSGEWDRSQSPDLSSKVASSRNRRGSSNSSNSSISPVREGDWNDISRSANVTSPGRKVPNKNRPDNRSVDEDHSRPSSQKHSQDRKRRSMERLDVDDDRSQDRNTFRSIRNNINIERHKSYGPQSPDRRSDSDGRSNISSNSSLGSPVSQKSMSPEPKRGNKPDKIEIKSHGEDLSDVSDVESIGSTLDEEHKPKETKKVSVILHY